MISSIQLLKQSVLLQIEYKTQQIWKNLSTNNVKVFTLGTVETVIL